MSASSSKKYFDLHITGIGYVNRVREVKPKRGAPFLACSISALTGPSDAVEYRYFDVKVTGADAQHLIRRCKEASDAERKILIGFRLGDPWLDIFTYPADHHKAGQTGVSHKARLLYVSWIKIDGKLEYEAKSKSADDVAEDTTLIPEAPAPDVQASSAETSVKAA
jgi:hypothetical protein